MAVTVVLPGCGAAQDAVSDVTASVKQQAEQKAEDVAARAFRSQVCSMTADGKLTPAELGRLRGELDAAEAAGAPAPVVATVRALLAKGGSASTAQVHRVHDATCEG